MQQRKGKKKKSFSLRPALVVFVMSQREAGWFVPVQLSERLHLMRRTCRGQPALPACLGCFCAPAHLMLIVNSSAVLIRSCLLQSGVLERRNVKHAGQSAHSTSSNWESTSKGTVLLIIWIVTIVWTVLLECSRVFVYVNYVKLPHIS